MRLDFNKWFESNLEVSGYPVALLFQECKMSEHDFIINVSDEFNLDHVENLSEHGYKCLWFPLGQSSSDMGLVSLFGSLFSLYQCYEQNKKVLLHCRQGHNRSQMVKHAFHYLMQEKHFELGRNMLIENCQQNHLPELVVMEAWLSRCKEAFENQSSFKGNMLDWSFKNVNFENKFH